MKDFSKEICITNNFCPEFIFNGLHTIAASRYYISVLDDERHSYFFNMEEKGGSWKIIDAPKVPDWIMAIEKKLEDAIFENMMN